MCLSLISPPSLGWLAYGCLNIKTYLKSYK
jgi:hypothetical protein